MGNEKRQHGLHVALGVLHGAKDEPVAVSVQCARIGALAKQALCVVYVAAPGNHAFLGAAPLIEMAAQIRAACGPSVSHPPE